MMNFLSQPSVSIDICQVVKLQTIYMFTPKIGEHEPILTKHMFQMGWFNQHLVMLGPMLGALIVIVFFAQNFEL